MSQRALLLNVFFFYNFIISNITYTGQRGAGGGTIDLFGSANIGGWLQLQLSNKVVLLLLVTNKNFVNLNF